MIKYEDGKIVYLLGDRGVGKTTFLACLAKGWWNEHEIYCNFLLQGTNFFDVNQFGDVYFPKKSVIMIDEAAIEFGAREFKTFKKEITKFMKLCRHHQVMLVFCSQNYNDTDKSIRDASTELYVLNKFGDFTIGKRIVNQLVLVPSQNGQQGYIGFDLHFAGLLTKGSRIVCFRPLYYKYFDSWDLDLSKDLKPVNALKVPIKKKTKERKSLGIFLRPIFTRQRGK